MTLKGLFNLALELSLKKTTQLKNIDTTNLSDDTSYANALNNKLQPENEANPIVKNIFIILNHCVNAQITPPTSFKLFQAISSISPPNFTSDDSPEYQELYAKLKDEALIFVNERKAANKNSTITTKQSNSSPAVAPPAIITSAKPDIKNDSKNALPKKSQPGQMPAVSINNELKNVLLKRSQANAVTTPPTSNKTDFNKPQPPQTVVKTFLLPRSSQALTEQKSLSTQKAKPPLPIPPRNISGNTSYSYPPASVAQQPSINLTEQLNKQLEIEKQKNRILEEKLADRQKKLDAAEAKLNDQHKVLMLFHENLKSEEKTRKKIEAELVQAQQTAENTFLYIPSIDGDIQANELNNKLQPYIHSLAQDKCYDLLYTMACDSIADNSMMKGYLGYFYKEYKDANHNLLFYSANNIKDAKKENREFNDRLREELFSRYQDAMLPDSENSQFTPKERAAHKLCANFFAITLERMDNLKNKSPLSQLNNQPFTAFVQRNKTKLTKEIEKTCTLLLYKYMGKNTLDMSSNVMKMFMPTQTNSNSEEGITGSLTSITQSLTSKVMWALGK